MYTVLVQPSADRSLRKLPDDVQRRIIAALDELGNDPRPAGCKKLKGELN
jgi:mRNA interferase RelE/StbE